MPGGHSLEQLNKALGLSIQHRWEDEELEVEVVLRNKGAGHAVPTGMPGRRVILDLVLRSGEGHRFEERKVYGKFFSTGEPARSTVAVSALPLKALVEIEAVAIVPDIGAVQETPKGKKVAKKKKKTKGKGKK